MSNKKGYHSSYKPQEKGLYARARTEHAKHYPDQRGCELCGEIQEQYMNIHHIDGNIRNNDISNLIKLCNVCHDNIHHNKTLQISTIISRIPVLSF